MTRREQRDLILAILVFVFVNFSISFSIGFRWSKAGDAAATWPVAVGRIVSTNDTADDIRYAYEVQGALYQHSRIRFGFLGDAREALPPFTNGAVVKVSHHPSDPREAVLFPGSSAGTLAMKGIGMFGMIATCVAAFVVWRFFPVQEAKNP